MIDLVGENNFYAIEFVAIQNKNQISLKICQKKKSENKIAKIFITNTYTLKSFLNFFLINAYENVSE